MRFRALLLPFLSSVTLLFGSNVAVAASFPEPIQHDWVVRDFRFHTGEVLPELKMHYTTIGAATGEPVVIMHGTAQSGAAMLAPGFAGELFGPG